MDFLPVREEIYDLCFPDRWEGDHRIQPSSRSCIRRLTAGPWASCPGTTVRRLESCIVSVNGPHRRSPSMNCTRMPWVVTFLAIFPLSCHPSEEAAVAQEPPGILLRVEGDVPRTLELIATDLARLPHRTVRAKDHDGRESTFQGVPLVEVLKAAGVKFGNDLRGPAWQHISSSRQPTATGSCSRSPAGSGPHRPRHPPGQPPRREATRRKGRTPAHRRPGRETPLTLGTAGHLAQIEACLTGVPGLFPPIALGRDLSIRTSVALLKDKAIVPDVLLQSHSASLDLTFYDGEQSPREYRNEIFASEHGSWNRARAPDTR